MESKLTPEQIAALGVDPTKFTTSASRVAKGAETEDKVRTELLNLAKMAKDNKGRDIANSIVFDATDVTGSQYCWGIVQLNAEGRPVRGGNS